MKPTVTVIMAAYNGAAFIREAIESVLAQTFTDWELVVVDDGSTDGTAQIAAGYDDRRVRLLTIEHNGHIGVVRNRGLRTAESPYVALLDQDDLWRPEKLGRQVALLGSRPEVGLVHTGFELLRNGVLEPVRTPPELAANVSQFERLATSNYIASGSVLLRKELLARHGFFDEDPRLRGTDDFELWMRLSPHTTFAYLEEPLMIYRLHASNMSGQGQGEHMALGYLTAMEKMERLYPDLAARLGVAYWRKLGYTRCYLGVEGRGRRELLRVLRRWPRDRFAWKWLARSFLPADFVREHGSLRAWAAGYVHRSGLERRGRTT